MSSNEKIEKVVSAAIDQVNEARPVNAQIGKAPQERLIGSGGQLDSLGLVNFMVSVEEAFEREFGQAISLADVLGSKPEESPFRTPAALADYLRSLVR